MTLRKRLKQILAALRQEWHENTCSECGFQWMAEGPERPELIRVCDRCELENLNHFIEFAEREYQRLYQKKGA